MRTNQDIMTLRNRIRLLEQEEDRVNKKIRETKGKRFEIEKVQKRNWEMAAKKE